MSLPPTFQDLDYEQDLGGLPDPSNWHNNDIPEPLRINTPINTPGPVQLTKEANEDKELQILRGITSHIRESEGLALILEDGLKDKTPLPTINTTKHAWDDNISQTTNVRTGHALITEIAEGINRLSERQSITETTLLTIAAQQTLLSNILLHKIPTEAKTYHDNLTLKI